MQTIEFEFSLGQEVEIIFSGIIGRIESLHARVSNNELKLLYTIETPVGLYTRESQQLLLRDVASNGGCQK